MFSDSIVAIWITLGKLIWLKISINKKYDELKNKNKSGVRQTKTTD